MIFILLLLLSLGEYLFAMESKVVDASTEGSNHAQFRKSIVQGRAYMWGDGVQPDYVKARECFMKAADQGSDMPSLAWANVSLAMLHRMEANNDQQQLQQYLRKCKETQEKFGGLQEVLLIAKILEDDSDTSKLKPGQNVQAIASLHSAALEGYHEAAKLLMFLKADINQGMTPLDCAVWKGHPELAQSLLARGARLGILFKNRTLIAETLIAKGVNLAAVVNEDVPLIYAAARSGDKEITALLIAQGAEQELSKWGLSALHIAARNGETEVLKLLISQGAKPDICSKAYVRFHFVVCGPHLEYKWESTIDHSHGLPCSYWAVWYGHKDVLEFLLSLDAKIFFSNPSPLEFLSLTSHFSALSKDGNVILKDELGEVIYNPKKASAVEALLAPNVKIASHHLTTIKDGPLEITCDPTKIVEKVVALLRNKLEKIEIALPRFVKLNIADGILSLDNGISKTEMAFDQLKTDELALLVKEKVQEIKEAPEEIDMEKAVKLHIANGTITFL